MQTLLVLLSIYLFYFNISWTLSQNTTEHSIQESSFYRKEKFFGVGIVRFENGVCPGLDNLQGTCYTRRQCANIAGAVASGQCARGIGVCCVVQTNCGDITSTNNTYFVSPNFPVGYSGGGVCTITVQPCGTDICQLRIDFLAFNLAQPDANGLCTNDAMYIIGGASTIPAICGQNSGQHIYVDFDGSQNIQISIATSSAIAMARQWNLRIAQIGCDCPTRAPAGCLMYYTALSGTITSFNYGTTAASGVVAATGAPGTRQLANTNYGVCIQMQPGYCSIQYSQTSDVYSFTVSGDTITDTGAGTVGTPAVALTGANCLTDFVVIPNPILADGTALNSDRICGNGFPTVTTSSKPFVLTVVTDGTETTDAGNRGFSLNYAQQSCTANLIFR